MSDFNSGLSEDLSLPKATVQKIISEVLPKDLAFSKDARQVLIECCIEFIMILATESNEIAEKEAKKTIASDHVLKALTELGYDDYLNPIRQLLAQHKESVKGREKKNSKFQNSGLTEEELLKKQEELFRLSRNRLQNNGQVSPTTPTGVDNPIKSEIGIKKE
ncbi:negative cofactor 2 transcription regulator complex subunit [Saccharomycopsis crataegensis]|uniref:Negative cofactor 2 transcription regulator complex subunit n=1 Tax=Saccharomycopsis crataegensis TaxID=43959 RepID=A0AAV5QQ32_9ASCO|nr:negative cofactor 2 transcription regulator complex subunit [Saccharomycopsis crataegensis]